MSLVEDTSSRHCNLAQPALCGAGPQQAALEQCYRANHYLLVGQEVAEPCALDVTAVGQFKRLAQWAEQDRNVCEQLKKVLKLTKGWELARDHAAQAVENDNRMRVYTHDGRTGLLFKCQQGNIEASDPVGELSALGRGHKNHGRNLQNCPVLCHVLVGFGPSTVPPSHRQCIYPLP